MNIIFAKDLSGVTEDMLKGFFVGWLNPPNTDAFIKILQGSYCCRLAVDADAGRAVGFVNAISDGVLAAYIPLLEVLPEYQGRGIGGELLRLILDDLQGFYMVDLLCDADKQGFYAKHGMHRACGMMLRNRRYD